MSCCRDEELEQQKRTNRLIERELKVERKTRRGPVRLLLLGTEAWALLCEAVDLEVDWKSVV